MNLIFFRYLTATGISAAMSVGLPIVFVSLFGVVEEIAVAVSFVIAFFVNFLNVKIFVFRSNAPASTEFVSFVLTNAFFRLVDYAGFVILFKLVGLNYILSLLLILSLTSIARFIIFSLIFRNQE